MSICSASSAARICAESRSSRSRRSVASASRREARTLRDAPACALRLVGVQVHLHFRARRDDRPDVAPLDHDVAVLAELALPLAHHLAHLRVARDRRDDLVDARLADLDRHVAAVDQDVLLVLEADRMLAGERAEALRVVEVGCALEREPGQRAVHRARVEVAKAEPRGELPRHRALACPSGAVDGDDHRLLTGVEELEETGEAYRRGFGPFEAQPFARHEPRNRPEHRDPVVALRNQRCLPPLGGWGHPPPSVHLRPRRHGCQVA